MSTSEQRMKVGATQRAIGGSPPTSMRAAYSGYSSLSFMTLPVAEAGYITGQLLGVNGGRNT
jgi:hypothetical protein